MISRRNFLKVSSLTGLGLLLKLGCGSALLPGELSPPEIHRDYECSSLSKYPDAFQINGVFNGYFVVGEAAQPIDNLSMTDIATNMWYEKPNLENPNEGELSLIQVVDSFKLDTETDYNFGVHNIITVGRPCVNEVTAKLLNNPADCYRGFHPGEARVILLKNKVTDNLAMIVAGYKDEDTRLAAKVIAHRWTELQQLGGCEAIISGENYSSAVIRSVR